MIYLFVLYILLVGIFIISKKSTSKKKYWYAIECICLILLSGLRYHVGGDSLAYEEDFESGTYPKLTELYRFDFKNSEYQPLWYLLVAIVKSIANDFILLQIVHSLFINIVVFWFIRRYSKKPFTMVLVYFVMTYLYFNMEILRESIAVCIFLLSIPYLQNKRYLQYYILVILAIGFHFSALILIPIPLIIKANTASFSIKQGTIALAIIFVLSLTPAIRSVLNAIDFSMVISRYETYSGLKSNFVGQIFPIIRSVFMLMLIVPIAKFRENKGFENGIINTYLLIVFIGILLQFFYRFENYLIIPFYVIILNNYYGYKKFSTSKRLKMRSAYIVFLIGISFILLNKTYYYVRDQSEFNYSNTAHYYNRYYPYSSVFEKKEDSRRNNIYWNFMYN